ncbi:MAG: hypothetical protein ACD_58C00306G0004 [uncultured bacterium]|nr:MAG: hypothetical protein ACD_58C00306G0004 [uncultured bacterium]
MNIFIDESGIHKKVDHSTFVVVYIEVENYSDIEKQIIQIEKDLLIESFHWSKTVWHIKEKFIEKILKLDFKVKIALVKNPVNPSIELERVLLHTIIEKDIKNIFIDGKKPKWYERKIKHILREKGISIRKLKTVKGSQFAGIRLADMVAGLARSYFDKKNPERFDKYYKKLQSKIIVIIE